MGSLKDKYKRNSFKAHIIIQYSHLVSLKLDYRSQDQNKNNVTPKMSNHLLWLLIWLFFQRSHYFVEDFSIIKEDIKDRLFSLKQEIDIIWPSMTFMFNGSLYKKRVYYRNVCII